MDPLQALAGCSVTEVLLTAGLARPGLVCRRLAQVDVLTRVMDHAAARETGYVTGGHHFIDLSKMRR